MFHVEKCDPQSMTIHKYSDETSIEWLIVFPDTFYPPAGFVGHEYRYTVHLEGLAEGVVAAEAITWSRLRRLYR
jgi:hypothetical protein